MVKQIQVINILGMALEKIFTPILRIPRTSTVFLNPMLILMRLTTHKKSSKPNSHSVNNNWGFQIRINHNLFDHDNIGNISYNTFF